MPNPTPNTLWNAYKKAIKKARSDDKLTSSSVSAGFVLAPVEKPADVRGWQVFVKVCRYSEKRLKEKPDTGGLWET